MRSTIFKIFFLIFLFLLFWSLTSCAGRLNLIESNKYSIEELKTDAVEISSTEVYLDNNTFYISGNLHRVQLFSYLPGHVDIVIVEPNGNIFEQVSVTHSLPFITYRRRNSSFKADFQRVPPEGSTIRVGFHKEEFKEYEQFDCRLNAALKNN